MFKVYIDGIRKFNLESEVSINEIELFKNDKKEEFIINGKEINILTDYDFSGFYYFIINGVKVLPIYRYIVLSNEFDDYFYYDGDDLGSKYHSSYTDFKVFAPTAKEVYVKIIDDEKYLMNKDRGVHFVRIEKNLENYQYLYEVVFENKTIQTIDPYSFATTRNAQTSIILDESKFEKEVIKPNIEFNNYTDAIIYEVSIRDISSHSNSNHLIKSKFESLFETTSYFKYPTGYDYLKSLGFTHIQLLPIFDFDSYDENEYYENYNWGYDPIQYSTVEGSYLNNDSGYNRVNIFRELVNKFHKDNIRVNLDVVFNHVYKVENFAYEKLVPYYSFRLNEDNSYSNGSFCGNEVRSEAKMIRKYIIDMCLRYIKIFDIDGLRFDLMGLLDIETMQKLSEKCFELKKEFMIYGEGWNMPSTLPNHQKSTIDNNYQLKNIAFFNDKFRDNLKGATSLDNIMDRGYGLGDLNKDIENIIVGNCLNGHFYSNNQSINYVECHDNMTLFDKMNVALNDDYYSKKSKANLIMAIIMLSQGIPFIHCGQEFLRTKQGKENSYNLPDKINAIDYALTIKNSDSIQFFKDLIKIRKKYSSFRIVGKEEIEKRVSFERHYNYLIYKVDDFKVFINPSNETYYYDFNKDMKLIFQGKIEEKIITNIKIDPISVVIVKEYE